MSAKTKIVVVHMRNLILTGVLLGIGILLLLMSLTICLSQERKKDDTASTQSYIPGVYSSSVKLNDTAIDVQVTVDENNINSVALINLNDTVETMYPLVKPAMEDLQNQILEKQSTSNIDYSENSQYTSKVLLNAIDDALSKAKLSY